MIQPVVTTPTLAAVLVPASPEAGEPSIGPLTLASHRRIDPHADLKGDGIVYITDQNVTVRAQVRTIERLDVLVTQGAGNTVARASGVPDTYGEVLVRLHLPQIGEIYLVEAIGVLADPQQNHACAITNERNECIITAKSALRIMAEP